MAIKKANLIVDMRAIDDNEPLQLSDMQCIMLRQFVIRLPYVSRTAVQKALE